MGVDFLSKFLSDGACQQALPECHQCHRRSRFAKYPNITVWIATSWFTITDGARFLIHDTFTVVENLNSTSPRKRRMVRFLTLFLSEHRVGLGHDLVITSTGR